MRIRFTKMQGAGNDFVVLDETQGRLHLSVAQYRFLADRHFGVGADQILSVRPSPLEGADFEYVIHNADGGEVEQCGNGSRCFVRFVREKGLTEKTRVKVKVHGGVIELQELPNGQVRVDMGEPIFDPTLVPFDTTHAQAAKREYAWTLQLNDTAWAHAHLHGEEASSVDVGVVSMGNPHAVQLVTDAANAPVLQQGPFIENHRSFPRRVNAGFMQVVNRNEINLRVFERGAGETLACGTGACAAVVMGIRWGLLDAQVLVHTHGGDLTIEWDGQGSVMMTGPAVTVFDGEINIPDAL